MAPGDAVASDECSRPAPPNGAATLVPSFGVRLGCSLTGRLSHLARRFWRPHAWSARTSIRPRLPPYRAIHQRRLQTTAATPGVAGGEAQHFVSGADIPADWWTLFHSRALNALIEQALAHNADLKAAQAALLVAHENVLAQRGNYFPKVSAGASITREKDPSATLAPVPSNNSFLYTSDHASAQRLLHARRVRPQQTNGRIPAAQEQASRYQMIAADITLSTNVANAVFQKASLDDQIDATNELIGIDRQMLSLLQYQQSKGYAAGPTSLRSRPSSRSSRHRCRRSSSNATNRIISSPSLPAASPAQRRPEVHAREPQPAPGPAAQPSLLSGRAASRRASGRGQHAFGERSDRRRPANRLPNITLSANAGSNALAISQLFGPGTGFWNIGAALLAPIFDGGTLLHQQRAARAAYQQAAEQYRGTVLTAFQNVADTLSALEHDAEALKSTAAAADAAKTSLDLSRLHYKDGYASYLAVLNAEQAYQQQRLSLVQAEAARFSDTAALFQALGGGWWHQPELGERCNARLMRFSTRAVVAFTLALAACSSSPETTMERRRPLPTSA